MTFLFYYRRVAPHHHAQEEVAPPPDAALLSRCLWTEPAVLILILDDVVQKLLGLLLESIIIQGPGERHDAVEPVGRGFA